MPARLPFCLFRFRHFQTQKLDFDLGTLTFPTLSSQNTFRSGLPLSRAFHKGLSQSDACSPGEGERGSGLGTSAFPKSEQPQPGNDMEPVTAELCEEQRK